METFADRFQSVLDIQKVKQTELAAFLEVTKQAVSGWAKGVTYPNANNLSKIAEYLNVDLNWLIRGIGSYSIVEKIIDAVSDMPDSYNAPLDIVSRISKLQYREQDVIGTHPRGDVMGHCFFLQMPDNFLLNETEKSIKAGDLLVIDPMKKIYPGDLVVVLTVDGRQFIRFVEDAELTTYRLQGGITITVAEIEAIFRATRVIPKEFDI